MSFSIFLTELLVIWLFAWLLTLDGVPLSKTRATAMYMSFGFFVGFLITSACNVGTPK